MNVGDFRQALHERQRIAGACARARWLGSVAAEETALDDLDRTLFSPAAAREAAELYRSSAGTRALAEARARLALSLEWGARARLRPFDRALAAARTRGSFQEALAAAERKRRALAEEGQRRIGSDAQGGEMLAVLAELRGEDLGRLRHEAEDLLARSEALAGTVFRATRPARGFVDSTTAAESTIGPASLPSRLEALLHDPVMEGEGSLLLAAVPALRELGEDLLLDTKRELRIEGSSLAPPRAKLPVSAPWAVEPASGAATVGRGEPRRGSAGPPEGAAASQTAFVFEEDPPRSVILFLAERKGVVAFSSALAAGGEALAAKARAEEMPVELRLAVDRAVPLAIAALFGSLAACHRAVMDLGAAMLGTLLAREILDARLSASSFLARYALLAGGEEGAERRVLEAAALTAAPFADLPLEDDLVLESADRWRGILLMTALKERLRTRFGNLWYREKGAGRLLREICEPAASVSVPEIVSGLSLAGAGVEAFIESWKEAAKHLR